MAVGNGSYRYAGGHPTIERAAEIGEATARATLQAFSLRGGDFSMDEIARLAGVSKQAIYRRWDSKMSLLLDALDKAIALNLVHIRANLPPCPMAALELIAWRIFEGHNTSFTRRISIFLQAESLRNPHIQDRLVLWRDEIRAIIILCLAEREGPEAQAANDSEAQVDLLLDMLFGASVRLVTNDMLTLTTRKQTFAHIWDVFSRSRFPELVRMAQPHEHMRQTPSNAPQVHETPIHIKRLQ